MAGAWPPGAEALGGGARIARPDDGAKVRRPHDSPEADEATLFCRRRTTFHPPRRTRIMSPVMIGSTGLTLRRVKFQPMEAHREAGHHHHAPSASPRVPTGERNVRGRSLRFMVPPPDRTPSQPPGHARSGRSALSGKHVGDGGAGARLRISARGADAR